MDLKSEITPTQPRASPGDGSMGTTDPNCGGVGVGPGAQLGVGRKLQKKNHFFASIFMVFPSSKQAAASLNTLAHHPRTLRNPTPKSEITPTQPRASPGDGSMGPLTPTGPTVGG